eukprot:TRINITY_DN3093_c0_g1_i2.p1 TRINITY_DN3093_c0_g1~~TRINITY_DN3093_c0_g1_i2.p1  ORF type:complete len:159 (+),score=74.65 TRINITY_DN3093_c0_g1_i2:53-529(+)
MHHGGASTHEHNAWDKVRVKDRKYDFRCRECQEQFRETVFTACRAFENGECTDENCTAMHIYKKKEKLRERVAKHGSGVLATVPSHMHPKKRKRNKKQSNLSMSTSSVGLSEEEQTVSVSDAGSRCALSEEDGSLSDASGTGNGWYVIMDSGEVVELL